MAIVGAPIAAGLSAIAPRLVPLFYDTQFVGAVMPLTILPWVLLPIFIDFPVGSLLNATHRAHLKTTAMGGAMVVNAVLNVLLVPQLGPTGAAWAAVGSFWFLLLLGIVFAWKELPSAGWLASLLARSLLAAAVIWTAVRALGEALPFAFMLLFGGAVGIVAMLVLRLLTPDDIRMIGNWLHARVRPPVTAQEQLHDPRACFDYPRLSARTRRSCALSRGIRESIRECHRRRR
jgi:O-antigen/teichoic acid export membrane protein